MYFISCHLFHYQKHGYVNKDFKVYIGIESGQIKSYIQLGLYLLLLCGLRCFPLWLLDSYHHTGTANQTLGWVDQMGVSRPRGQDESLEIW